jgi:hypothetical protein
MLAEEWLLETETCVSAAAELSAEEETAGTSETEVVVAGAALEEA